MTATIDRFRLGRNYVKVGDVVHVAPSRPNKRDGFDTIVDRIEADDDGRATAVHVFDPDGRARILPIDRIERRAQTGNPAEQAREQIARRRKLEASVKPRPPRRGRMR